MFNSFFKFVADNLDEIDNEFCKMTLTIKDCKAFLCFNETDPSWEDYCPYHQKCLSKLQQRESISNSEIRRLETFETWFNGNCGYVILERNSNFSVWLVIYEPAKEESMRENIAVIKHELNNININLNSLPPNNLGSAEQLAKWLKKKLQNDDFCATPLLDVDFRFWKYRSFNDVITSPYVISYSVGTYNYNNNFFYWEAWGSDPSNWDRHVRPLDIIKIGKKHKTWTTEFSHVGVYLGNNKVCHIYDYWSESNMKARIDDISVFVGSTTTTARCGRVWVYHPVIPFKHYSKIARQIAGLEENDYWKGRYDLLNRNCEHFSNMLVYGINFSEQVERKRGVILGTSDFFQGLLAIPSLGVSLIGDRPTLNNNKSSTITLAGEINETNRKLGYSGSDHWRAKEIERQYLQEVPAKETCRIM